MIRRSKRGRFHIGLILSPQLRLRQLSTI